MLPDPVGGGGALGIAPGGSICPGLGVAAAGLAVTGAAPPAAPRPGVGPECAAAEAAADALLAPVVSVTSGGTSDGSRRSAKEGE